MHLYIVNRTSISPDMYFSPFWYHELLLWCFYNTKSLFREGGKVVFKLKVLACLLSLKHQRAGYGDEVFWDKG